MEKQKYLKSSEVTSILTNFLIIAEVLLNEVCQTVSHKWSYTGFVLNSIQISVY